MTPDEFPQFELEFDAKGKFRHGHPVNFNPYDDKAVTVSILKKQLADVEKQLSSGRPQTDKFLTRLAKEKSALETLIESFSDAGASTVVSAKQSSKRRFTYKPRRASSKGPALLRSAATTQIGRPLSSVVAIEPQFHPALRRFSMMISQYFI